MVHQSDVVFLHLGGTKKVSIGCVSELAWGHDLGKHTVIVMEKENIHRHAFVLEMADIIFETYDKAMEYLEKLIKGDL